MVTIVDILNQWQYAGIFDYALPFLLIFSIVFGVLSATNILGKNKGVHVLVALIVGLLALRLDFMQVFFVELFPRLGVGLAVILALIIMTGLFIHEKESKYWMWGIAALAVIIWLIVLVGSFENVGWIFGYGFFEDYAGAIIGAVLLIGVIIAVVAAKSEGQSEGEFKRFKAEK